MANKTEYTYTYANGDTYKLTVGEGKGQVSEEWIRILHDLDCVEKFLFSVGYAGGVSCFSLVFLFVEAYSVVRTCGGFRKNGVSFLIFRDGKVKSDRFVLIIGIKLKFCLNQPAFPFFIRIPRHLECDMTVKHQG